MDDVLQILRDTRIAAIVQAPERAALIARAEAAAKGGIALLALPVTIPFVAEIAAEIADRIDATVGLADVTEQEHVSVALAAGAEFVISPLWDEALAKACRQRGLAIVPSISTPTELMTASRGHEGPIAVYPVTSLGGPDYLARLVRLRPSVPIIAAGEIGLENGPLYLEAGAAGLVIDAGLFPTDDDPASLEVITVRASALVEICRDAIEAMRPSTTPA